MQLFEMTEVIYNVLRAWYIYILKYGYNKKGISDVNTVALEIEKFLLLFGLLNVQPKNEKRDIFKKYRCGCRYAR